MTCQRRIWSALWIHFRPPHEWSVSHGRFDHRDLQPVHEYWLKSPGPSYQSPTSKERPLISIKGLMNCVAQWSVRSSMTQDTLPGSAMPTWRSFTIRFQSSRDRTPSWGHPLVVLASIASLWSLTFLFLTRCSVTCTPPHGIHEPWVHWWQTQSQSCQRCLKPSPCFLATLIFCSPEGEGLVHMICQVCVHALTCEGNGSLVRCAPQTWTSVSLVSLT